MGSHYLISEVPLWHFIRIFKFINTKCFGADRLQTTVTVVCVVVWGCVNKFIYPLTQYSLFILRYCIGLALLVPLHTLNHASFAKHFEELSLSLIVACARLCADLFLVILVVDYVVRGDVFFIV